MKDLTTQQFITKLQEAYSGTTLKDTSELLRLDLLDSNKVEASDKLSVVFINNHLGG